MESALRSHTYDHAITVHYRNSLMVLGRVLVLDGRLCDRIRDAISEGGSNSFSG